MWTASTPAVLILAATKATRPEGPYEKFLSNFFQKVGRRRPGGSSVALPGFQDGQAQALFRSVFLSILCTVYNTCRFSARSGIIFRMPVRNRDHVEPLPGPGPDGHPK